jgi:hypothetical protein
MRYIIVPPNVKIVSPVDDATPVLDAATGLQAEGDFVSAVRNLTNEIMKAKTLDLLDALELRIRLTSAKIGEEVALEDKWWEALVETFKRPDGFTLVYLASCKPHVMAVNEATTSPRSS